MSIHQPRYSIFKLFDTLTLLSRGDLVYLGPSRMALGYFDRIGELSFHMIVNSFLSVTLLRARESERSFFYLNNDVFGHRLCEIIAL